MANTRYRRGGAYAADMAVYARAMAADNSAQLSRVKRNLVRALREDVTPRQREVLLPTTPSSSTPARSGKSWGWTSPP